MLAVFEFFANNILMFFAICIILFIILAIAVVADKRNQAKKEQASEFLQMYVRDKQELESFKQKDAEVKEVAKRRRVSPTQRKAVLERDGYKCRICGISRKYLDDKVPGLGEYLRLEIDHIVPIAQGGTSDESNLQCLCWRCNSLKGSKRTNAQVNSSRTWGAGYLPGVSKKKSVPEIR